jgi:hypothetical protein
VDLLRSRSGVYHPVDFETESMQKGRPARGSHAPGTLWYYNNWDFNVLYQNFWLDGRPYWTGLQLDEVAFPVLLTWRLWKDKALGNFLPFEMVRCACGLLIREGRSRRRIAGRGKRVFAIHSRRTHRGVNLRSGVL